MMSLQKLEQDRVGFIPHKNGMHKEPSRRFKGQITMYGKSCLGHEPDNQI